MGKHSSCEGSLLLQQQDYFVHACKTQAWTKQAGNLHVTQAEQLIGKLASLILSNSQRLSADDGPATFTSHSSSFSSSCPNGTSPLPLTPSSNHLPHSFTTTSRRASKIGTGNWRTTDNNTAYKNFSTPMGIKNQGHGLICCVSKQHGCPPAHGYNSI